MDALVSKVVWLFCWLISCLLVPTLLPRVSDIVGKWVWSWKIDMSGGKHTRHPESSDKDETEVTLTSDLDDSHSSKHNTWSNWQAAQKKHYLTGTARQPYRQSSELSPPFKDGQPGPSQEAHYQNVNVCKRCAPVLCSIQKPLRAWKGRAVNSRSRRE